MCDNIDHAAALARAYDYKVRIVTLDGQQVNAGGSFTGGSVKQDSGMLTRSVEIEKLRGDCKQLSEQLDVCKHDAAEIEKAIKQQNDIIENIRVNAAMINTLSQAETTQQQVIEAQLKNDYDMLASLEAEEQKLANSEDLFREENDYDDEDEDEAFDLTEEDEDSDFSIKLTDIDGD